MEAEPPSMASLQPMTPPALDRVVKKCLAKEPEKRWQVASDLCDELKWIAEQGLGTQAAMPVSAGIPKRGIREHRRLADSGRRHRRCSGARRSSFLLPPAFNQFESHPFHCLSSGETNLSRDYLPYQLP